MISPSLYIHVPFCRHRCGYCNFALIANRDDLIDRYLAALKIEMDCFELFEQVSTIFLGGGTPSHLSGDQLTKLFEIIHARFNVANDAEVTIECNPSDVDAERASLFGSLGVNRISLGVQSVNSEKLQLLERDHRIEKIREAVELARQVTENVSLDMIFGTPGESVASWLSDLRVAIELQPAHMSTYELTIEKGTQFWNRNNRGTLDRPDEDVLAEMYERTLESLDEQGFQQYEISSFAKPGHECKHNVTYWNGQPYLAFGPGAARFYNATREQNHRSTTTYLKLVETAKSAVVERETLDRNSLALDRVVFGLRQIAGFSRADFERDFDTDPQRLLGDIGSMLASGELIEWNVEDCRLTRQGILMYDSIVDQIVAHSSGWRM